MSFSPGNTTKQAENNLGGTSNLLLNKAYPELSGRGGNLMDIGASTTQPGVNFFNTVAAGNQGNTTAALQPNIDAIRRNSGNALTAINTVLPRGGGRQGTNYAQSFAPVGDINNLFNQTRVAGATALPQIGLQQQGLGANLFGLGTQALNTAGGVNANLAQLGQNDTRRSDALWSGIGSTLFGLATTPFGGGSAQNGLFGLLGK
jgi:hypothetical protein